MKPLRDTTKSALQESAVERAKQRAFRDALLTKLAREGEGVRTMATRTGLSVDTVHRLLKQMGLRGQP